MSRYDQVEAFVRTVEAGSFTRAAATLHVDKSAVSRRVRDLERRLGVELLLRGGRALGLTPEGEALFGRAQELLADWQEAEGLARQSTDALEGTVRLSVPLSYGLAELSPVLARFATAHPGVELDVDFSDRKTDLLGEGFDLAVRGGTLSDSSLRARALREVEMWAAASPAFVEAHGQPRDAAALATLPELRYSLRPKTRWRITDPGGAVHTVELPVLHRATNGDFIRDLAVAGLGVAIEPDFILAPALERGELVRLLPDHAFGAVAFHAVWPPKRHLPARVRALIDHLVAECGR